MATTIYFLSAGLSHTEKINLLQYTETQLSSMAIAFLAYENTEFQVDENATFIEYRGAIANVNRIDSVVAFSGGEAYVFLVDEINRYEVENVPGYTFSLIYDPISSNWENFTVSGELVQGHQDNSNVFNYPNIFADEEKSIRTQEHFSISSAASENVSCVAVAARKDIRPDITGGDRIASDGVMWFLFRFYRGENADGSLFTNHLNLSTIQNLIFKSNGQDYLPLANENILFIVPANFSNFELSEFGKNIYEGCFEKWDDTYKEKIEVYTFLAYDKAAPSVATYFSPNPKYNVEISGDKITNISTATTVANGKQFLLPSYTIKILGADFPLNKKLLVGATTFDTVRIECEISYNGGPSIVARVRYGAKVDGVFVSESEEIFTRQIPLAVNVRNDPYTNMIYNQRASYYTSLLSNTVSSAGATAGALVSGNYFGAVQGVGAFLSPFFRRIELEEVPDTVSQQGQGLFEYVKYGDELIYDVLENTNAIINRWSLYGYNWFNQQISRTPAQLQQRAYFNYVKMNNVTIFANTGKGIPSKNVESIKNSFENGVFLKKGVNINIPEKISVNGGG